MVHGSMISCSCCRVYQLLNASGRTRAVLLQAARLYPVRLYGSTWLHGDEPLLPVIGCVRVPFQLSLSMH